MGFWLVGKLRNALLAPPGSAPQICAAGGLPFVLVEPLVSFRAQRCSSCSGRRCLTLEQSVAPSSPFPLFWLSIPFVRVGPLGFITTGELPIGKFGIPHSCRRDRMTSVHMTEAAEASIWASPRSIHWLPPVGLARTRAFCPLPPSVVPLLTARQRSQNRLSMPPLFFQPGAFLLFGIVLGMLICTVRNLSPEFCIRSAQGWDCVLNSRPLCCATAAGLTLLERMPEPTSGFDMTLTRAPF